MGSRMLRLALTPRWIALGILAIALIAGCVILGRWQWERTNDILAAERAAQGAPISVTELAAPGVEIDGADIGRQVRATGTYLDDLQIAVLNRVYQDSPGIWVVTPLRLADGSVIAINRGWLPDENAPGFAPPAGEVTVQGTYTPDESFYADSPSEPGRAVAISGTALGSRWELPTRSGYLNLVLQSPVSEPAPIPVPDTVQTSDVPFPLQNFGYAFQWWIFALFVVFAYVRWLRLDARPAADSAESDSTTVSSS
jgi:cytochrome oxidase assembly protein ShyY1